jgi:hypothetical protein
MDTIQLCSMEVMLVRFLHFVQSSQPWRPEVIKAIRMTLIFTSTYGLANGLDAILDVAKKLKNLTEMSQS